MTTEELLTALAEPFSNNLIQWRAGAVSKDKKRAQALAYVDPREYERRLDELLGLKWEVDFDTLDSSWLVCRLTLYPGGRDKPGITRASTGEFDDSDKISRGPTAEAQAFKRACSKFGLGRHLYDLPATWVGFDGRDLTETPTLSSRTMRDTSTKKAPAKAPAKAPKKVPAKAPKKVPKGEEKPAGIGAKRAAKLVRELGKLGIKDASSWAFEQTNGISRWDREHLGLADLPEEDAAALYNEAKAAAKRLKENLETANGDVEIEGLIEYAHELGFKTDKQILAAAHSTVKREFKELTDLTEAELIQVRVYMQKLKHAEPDDEEGPPF